MDHTEIKALLGRLGSTLDAAELHGLVCGLLGSMPSNRAKSRWFSELLSSTPMEAGDLGAHAADLKALDGLFEATVDEINAPDLSLQLVLPDDSESLSYRTDGLANWCTGFCLGVGLGTGWQGESDVAVESDSEIKHLPTQDKKTSDSSGSRSLPDDTLELLTDFTAIAKASADDEESDDAALFELEEYVRMGALLVFEELQPATQVKNPDPTRVH